MTKRAALLYLTLCVLTGGVAAQSRYTPTQYKVTLYEVAMSTDGTSFTTVFSNGAGLPIDIADPTSFSSVFGNATAQAGTYDWIRMVIGRDLVWSHPNAPVSRSNVTFTVTDGPVGPQPNQMSVYFATFDKGGRPNGPGGGQGTQTAPFLLGAGAEVAAGATTTLRMVFALTNALEDRGGGVFDLQPPQMFFVSEDGTATTLSGTFNTVLYNSVKEFSSNRQSVRSWSFLSGQGTLIFDGAGAWTWSGSANEFNVQSASGALDTGATRTGRYGANKDGSFWMLVNGEPGTLRGAVSADGKMLVATMFDSASSHMMIFGVQRATAASALNLNGGYYFTLYGSAYSSSATALDYQGCFGVVSGNGTGSVTGTSDCNLLRVTNPNGSRTITGPTLSLNDPFNDTLTISAAGKISNANGEIAGGILESGDAAAIAVSFATTYQPAHRFGFLVRQSSPGTFTAASLNATYFGGHFGDNFDSNQSTHDFFSGFFRIRFDGAGSATVTTLENREGSVAVMTFPQLYSVDSNTGIVTFRDPDSGGDANIKGAIGPNAGSFILSSQAQVQSQATNGRFLGLGLKQ